MTGIDEPDPIAGTTGDLRPLLRLFSLYTLGIARALERDARRVVTLSEEAISETGDNVLQVGKLVRQIEDAMAEVPLAADLRAEHSLLLAELKSETDAAIRNMQHQDIISQILAGAGRQIGKLEESADRLYRAACREEQLQTKALQELQSELLALIDALNTGDVHPVEQLSMRAGNVDLF